MNGSRATSLLTAVLLLLGCEGDTPRRIPANDVAAARSALEDARNAVRAATGRPLAERVREMTRLGLWSDADQLLHGGAVSDSAAGSPSARDANPDILSAEGELRFVQSRFPEA